ncbi:hypothetical protein GCM10010421_61720 [Streptomyces glaucus]|uniref:N-acetyltransferase domain-containing protein n=1 Tax=Streptomyces glaucus TaxID=284029 RepID=A0ABP5XPB8_9ACTN
MINSSRTVPPRSPPPPGRPAPSRAPRAPSRAVAERAGFTLEGTLRSAIDNKGVRRDCWVGSLLPSDLALPSTTPYLPAPARPS